jgi:hypothetical protein
MRMGTQAHISSPCLSLRFIPHILPGPSPLRQKVSFCGVEKGLQSCHAVGDGAFCSFFWGQQDSQFRFADSLGPDSFSVPG